MVCKVVVDGIIISCMVVLAGLLIATVNKLGLDEVVQWISFFESLDMVKNKELKTTTMY